MLCCFCCCCCFFSPVVVVVVVNVVVVAVVVVDVFVVDFSAAVSIDPCRWKSRALKMRRRTEDGRGGEADWEG